MRKSIGALAFTILSSCSIASTSSISLPGSEQQRLIANNLSLTADSLFQAYMSTNIEQRRLAEMYVLGVIDSSEGEYWCGFETASPDAIQEQVYIGLKRIAAESPNERAAAAIKSHLKTILPCKEKQ